MTTVFIKLTVPEGVDPEELLDIMRDDFYYANRETDDYGPHMENITMEIIGTSAPAPSED